MVSSSYHVVNILAVKLMGGLQLEVLLHTCIIFKILELAQSTCFKLVWLKVVLNCLV